MQTSRTFATSEWPTARHIEQLVTCNLEHKQRLLLKLACGQTSEFGSAHFSRLFAICRLPLATCNLQLGTLAQKQSISRACDLHFWFARPLPPLAHDDATSFVRAFGSPFACVSLVFDDDDDDRRRRREPRASEPKLFAS